mmetsp:Transcript_21713/g.51512  ORF Transcript_21713/g.51512 Transcript_21713/m.51512 type:complete len:224 (-) Transcript_21713:1163-1834(-)
MPCVSMAHSQTLACMKGSSPRACWNSWSRSLTTSTLRCSPSPRNSGWFSMPPADPLRNLNRSDPSRAADMKLENPLIRAITGRRIANGVPNPKPPSTFSYTYCRRESAFKPFCSVARSCVRSFTASSPFSRSRHTFHASMYRRRSVSMLLFALVNTPILIPSPTTPINTSTQYGCSNSRHRSLSSSWYSPRTWSAIASGTLAAASPIDTSRRPATPTLSPRPA